MKVRLSLALGAALLLVGSALAAEPFPVDDPNDPRFAASNSPSPTGQWNLFKAARNNPPTLHGSGIGAEEAWTTTIGRPDVVVAILDTGVDYDHEDLRNKIWLNPGELPPPRNVAVPCANDDCNADGFLSVLDFATDNRVSDSNGSGAIDRGDLRVFVNEIDDDGNGYVDDLSGWDSDDDDGDEFDHRFFGHGTGRAGILAPETNNTLGVAGVCPRCPLMNVRIDDTFVHTSEGVAKGAIYAIDNGAKVLNMALGGTSASRMSRGAFDYATSKNVLAVAASANEDSAHQNFQSVFDDVMTIGGVTANNRGATTSWMQKAWFSNYGAHMDVVAPTEVPGAAMSNQPVGGLPNHTAYTNQGSGTSSAVPHAAGVAGLIYSRAADLGLSLSAQEVRQIINMTAEDVGTTDGTSYPVIEGEWDRWTGYGRINAEAAMDEVQVTSIPPEADINSPDWYSLVDGNVTVRSYANARRRANFDYVLEWGTGVEPTTWTPLTTGTDVAALSGVSSANRTSNLSTPWNVSALAEGLYTLRLTVTDNLGNDAQDRMAVWVRHADPQDMPGFPRKLSGSIESLSVALVDLNGDNTLETIFSDGNGEVHALRHTGAELPGFPVHTNLPHLPLQTSPAFDGNAGNGELPRSFASIIGGVAVGDADRDGVQEIFASAFDGRLYCWNANGSVCAGFPVATDAGFSRDQYGSHQQRQNNHPEGMIATPTLGNLDGDAQLEIVGASIDQKLYVWNHDGARKPGFPIQLFDPGEAGVSALRPSAIISTAVIADVDADGTNEIVTGTNEAYDTPNPTNCTPGDQGCLGGSGRLYLLEANGAIVPGWPADLTSIDPNPVPLVAEGVGTSPIVANIEGDAKLEVIAGVMLGDAQIFGAAGNPIRTLQGAPFGTSGQGGNEFDETTPEGGLSSEALSRFYVAQGAIGNFDAVPGLDYLAGTVGGRIVTSATDPGPNVVFDHLFSAWSATTGAQKTGFPRVMEDWQFLNGPAIAEISGDGLPEAIESSGGFYVHAFNQAGLPPTPDWPKLTGQWQTATPAVGDLDGDGDVEIVQATRLGTVFVWSSGGNTCQPDEWRKFHHDEWNTGAYGIDTRRPNRITDLGVEGSRFSATFTSPGDDGSCGTAAGYQMRVSRDPLTEASFSSATAIAAPVPSAPGTAETHSFSAPSWARHVGIRAVDEAGNAGPVTSARLCTQVGTPGDDEMRGTTADDILCGGDGNDTLRGLRGADVLIGGLGRDVLRGQRGRDVLLGQEGRDRLFGGRGRDRLVGGPSRDRLVGGRGDDVCRGGPGLDNVTGC